MQHCLSHLVYLLQIHNHGTQRYISIALSRVGFPQSQLSILILNEDFKQLSGCVKVQINICFCQGFMTQCLVADWLEQAIQGPRWRGRKVGLYLSYQLQQGVESQFSHCTAGIRVNFNKPYFSHFTTPRPPDDVIFVHVVRFIHAERVRQIELTTENQFQKSTT